MSGSGWVMMVASIGLVSSLLGWCVWRVTRETRAEKLPAQPGIDTHERP